MNSIKGLFALFDDLTKAIILLIIYVGLSNSIVDRNIRIELNTIN